MEFIASSHTTTNSKQNWQGCTLVLPVVAIGNIGQLAVDLLLNTFAVTRVGFLKDFSILPVAGHGALDYLEERGQSLLHIGLEVFYDEKNKLVFIQQRSPVTKSERNNFVNNLTNWIIAQQFSRVIMLTSADARRRTDKQISSSPFGYLISPTSAHFKDKLAAMKDWWPYPTDYEYIPGSGLTRRLVSSFNSKSIDFATLIMFTVDGNNSEDSIQYVHYLSPLLDISTSDVVWKTPKSWLGVYGSELMMELY